MNFNEIVTSIDSFNNLNVVNKTSRAVYTDKRKGNQHELDQFNWTMSCRNYRQKMNNISKGIKIKTYDEVNSLDKLQEILYKNELSQSWTRLEKRHKLEKISEHIANLGIDRDHLKQIKTFLYTKFNEGKLKSGKSVIYDKNECKITDIPILKDYIKTLK